MLDGSDTRTQLIARAKPNPTPEEVEALRAELPSAFWEREQLAGETVTIFVPLSGRDGPWRTHLRPFLDTQAWPRSLTRLVLADTSQRDDFGRTVQDWLATAGYPHARYYTQVVGEKGLAGKPRPNDGGVKVNAALRSLYARMAAELDTRYVLVVEDDHRPPPNAIERLLRGFDARTAAVSGLYRGREPSGHYVCWAPWQDRVRPELGQAIPVHGSGFGTLMIKRDPWLIGETFQHTGDPEPFPYDIGFAWRVRHRGGIWKVARDVLSHHAGAPEIPIADVVMIQTGKRREERATIIRRDQGHEHLVNGCPHRGCKVGCQTSQCRIGCGDRDAGRAATMSHCRKCVAGELPPSALGVAVVIPCHNYARYLGECIESVLAQTKRPAEILVVDDASDDDPASVVSRYPGVRYLRIDARDVNEARRAGFHATAAPILCFLDADNRMPRDYLASGVPSFADRRVGIVYSDLQHFGDSTDRTDFREFDADALESANYIDACALVTRQALTLSRAFDAAASGVSTCADWRLFRECVRAGFTAVKQPVALDYRVHSLSMSAFNQPDYYPHAGLAGEHVTVFLPLSGRREYWDSHLQPWLDAQSWPRSQTRLVIADTSQDPEFGKAVRAWLAASDYAAHDARYYSQVVGSAGLADLARIGSVDVEARVNDACRQIYGRMARELTTPYVLIVEDDHRPPVDAVDRLLHGFGPDVDAVTALYRTRFDTHGGWCAWQWDGINTAAHPLDTAGGVAPVGGSGFGTLLLRRTALAGETFARRVGDSPFYDVAFARRIHDRGRKWMLDQGCLSEHASAGNAR